MKLSELITVKIRLILVLHILVFFVGCTSSQIPLYEKNEKVIVLAHGLGRSDIAIWRFIQRLENAGYTVCTLDYQSIGQRVESVLAETSMQIDMCISNATKVHFVGHSLGGLVIRSYLQDHQLFAHSLRIGQVVLIGTPNNGSEIADHYKGSWLMELGGGISKALMTGSTALGQQLKEIDINVGVIAGTKNLYLTKNLFDGPNDGLVSVESTKLVSMSDFIAIEVGHSQMRYNLEVAEQTIHYLQKGTFKH